MEKSKSNAKKKITFKKKKQYHLVYNINGLITDRLIAWNRAQQGTYNEFLISVKGQTWLADPTLFGPRL